MKKILTLVAAAFMAVSVSAANKVLKITGTADNPGEDFSRQCFIRMFRRVSLMWSSLMYTHLLIQNLR